MRKSFKLMGALGKLKGKIVLLIFAFTIPLFTSSCIIKNIANKTFAKYANAEPYDVVIVPGVPYNPYNTNILYKARLLWAKSLFDRGIAKNIIFSGAAVHTPYEEAISMKLIAHKMGVPCDNIFIERNAESSLQNIAYGKALAQKMGFERIAVATDPFQMIYLQSYLSKKEPDIAKLTMNLDSLKTWYISKAVLPAINTSTAYVEDFVALKDR